MPPIKAPRMSKRDRPWSSCRHFEFRKFETAVPGVTREMTFRTHVPSAIRPKSFTWSLGNRTQLPRSCRSRPPHRVSTLPRLRAVRPRRHRTRATNPRRLTVEPARSLAPPSRSHRLERDHRRPGEETPHAPFDTVPGTRCPASTRSRAWPRSRRVARVSRCARRPRPRPRPSRRSRSAAARRSRCATARFPSTPASASRRRGAPDARKPTCRTDRDRAFLETDVRPPPSPRSPFASRRLPLAAACA